MINRGMAYAVVAYTLWGVLPIYWKELQGVPAYEILCHRMVWSLVFVVFLLMIRGRWAWLRTVISQPRRALVFLSTGCLLGINWFTYIWAVNSGYIVETSLGYFVNPLLYVLLGVIFLKEKLRPWQWAAIGIAASGVGYLTLKYGAFPWIALTLATTFGLYGLLRKTASVGALEGLSLETALLFLPAAGFLLHLEVRNVGAFGHADLRTNSLLALSGTITALPLLFFTAGARRIRLVAVGLLQYIAPTLQLLLGVLVYREVFSGARAIGFVIIWISLAVYSIEGFVHAATRAKRTGFSDRRLGEDLALR